MSSVAGVIKLYQDVMSSSIPFNFSPQRHAFGDDGVFNRFFVFSLCQQKELFQSFLRDLGLIKSEVNCPKCNSVMKIKTDSTVTDGHIWICNNEREGNTCESTCPIRSSSLFSLSKLTMEEILLMTYEIIRGTKTKNFHQEYSFASNTLVDWRNFVFETMFDHIERNSEKIGGVGKIVEIDESKIGKKRFHKDHPIEHQLAVGGVEKETGRLFLVTVSDRTQEELYGVMKDWIEKGTVIHSSCWKASDVLGAKNYNDLTVNHNLTFVCYGTECYTSKSTEGKNKVSMRKNYEKFEFYLAYHMLEKSCNWKKEDLFNKFLEITAATNWDECIIKSEKKKKISGGASTSKRKKQKINDKISQNNME